MDAKSAARDIEKGTVSPVYICYGTEKFLQQEFITYVVNRLVPTEDKAFAFTQYDLTETLLDVVLNDAETLPFLVPQKVIIARNALFFTGAKESSKLDHNLDGLMTYMKNPVDHTVLLFIVEADKLDERKKLVKFVKDKDWVIPFLPLSPVDLMRWVNRRAEKLRFSFQSEALEQFLLFTGGDLQTIISEMEKLSLYIGENGVMTTELIDQLVVRTMEQNIFILIEEIVQLRLDRALTMMYELLKQREEPIKIIVLMARQFRIILQVKVLERQGGHSQQQIASQIGVHPYAVKLASGQGRNYGESKLRVLLERLAELDYRIKSGKIDKVLGLELFILQIP